MFYIGPSRTSGCVVLTAVESVAQKLSKQGIPCELIPLTHLDIVSALERSLLSSQTRVNNEQQVIIGMIQIDNSEIHEKNKGAVKHILNEYIDSIDGYLVFSQSSDYIFVSSRGIFERESRGYKFLPLLQDCKTQTGISLSVGIGFGYSAHTAGKHAKLALTQAIDSGRDVCYIVREDQSVFGPIASTSSHPYEKYQITITNPQLLEQAEKLGMSATYMNKLMARVARFMQVEYTANDLSEILDITLRSANRILLKWNDAQLVSIAGEEKATRHGRPRRVYRLNFVANDADKKESTVK